MRKLKKAVSILLSIVLIGSMFTILSVTSASAETVQVFADKWVRAENETGDYFSFTDLYQNFIICRCWPEMDEPSFDYVYNQTANMSLTGQNEIRLNSWDDGNGKLDYYWSDNSSEAGNGRIYLSTNGDNINFNTDGVQWYAYTWETFTVDEVAATSPTCSNGGYTDGLSAHYESNDRYFVKAEGSTDGNQNAEQVSLDQITIPYFEYEYLNDNETIRLKKCNSDDADITVPDEIPSQYYPSDAPEGKTCTIIGEGAFAEKNNLTAVTIGDNVNHISGNTDAGAGAFSECGNLQSVTIGSSFNYAGQYCFLRCNNLTDFTTTSMARFPNQAYFSGLQDLSNATIHCYHGSGIASLCNDLDVTFDYLDEPPATHTYRADYWDWDNFDPDHTVKVFVSCSVCGKEFGEMDATIEEVVDTEPGLEYEGMGFYKAVITLDGQTLEDDDYRTHVFSIPKLVPYLDENGETQNVSAEPITQETHELTTGWYCVEGNEQLSGNIHLTGDVKIILTDGCELDLGNYWLGEDVTEDTSLTFYRQSGGTQGKLNADSISVTSLTVVGGDLNVNDDVYIGEDFTMSGGRFSANEIWTPTESTISLGWTDFENDCFLAKYINSDVTLVKPFKDQDGVVYDTGVYDMTAFEEKTLTPANVPMGAELEGHSISLAGDIAVNFYVKLSNTVAASENAYMQFEVPNTSTEYQQQTVYVKDLDPVTVNGEKYYVFKCRVAAKDMTEPILATLWDGYESCMFDPYSVTDYAYYLLNNTDIPAYAAAESLVRAMLTYGMHARAYFDSTKSALDIPNVIIPEYHEWVNADAEDIYDGMSISLKSQITLSLFFKSEDELTLTSDNPQYKTAQDGNNYVIRIRNIAAADLDKPITVEVNGSPAVVASPLTYCYKVQNSPDEKLANVAKALYEYWEAASLYFMS